MAKRRLKKDVIPKMGGIIILIIIIISVIKTINYRRTDEFKLKELGYDKTQIEFILKQEKYQIENILNRPYNEVMIKLYEEKYFIYENLDRYLAYYEKNQKDSLSHIVSIVNVNADYEHYDEKIINNADVSKGYLMLVNKYNKLDENYEVEDLVTVSNWYCYGKNELQKEAYENFLEMYKAASEENLKLIINSSYRDYNYQKKLYNTYKNNNGLEYADGYAARAGHSEHQTGYTIDLISKDPDNEDYALTGEYEWLVKNAHKYGYILRYPEGKEDITGYNYEPWHYRYVGVEVATKIHELGITFDEYYAYYLNK